MQRSLGWLTAVLALAWSVPAVAQETQTPSVRALPPPQPGGPTPTLDASGQISFGLQAGLGSGRGLAQKGYSQGIAFNQLLALNLEGGLPLTVPFTSIEGLFSISAQLNSQQADNLQTLKMHFDSEHWLADFGDFAVGEDAPEFVVPDRTLKGVKLQGIWDSFAFTGAFARVQGLAESKVFQGNKSSETVLFTRVQPDQPWLPAPYLKNLAGLEHFRLETFVEGFTQVRLNLPASPELEALLDRYELRYLEETLLELGDVPLEEGRFEVVRREGEIFLVLKREAFDLLRDRLQEAIDRFNREQDLPVAERKTYPFNEGTEFELGFLEALQALATLEVDGQRLGLGDYERGTFYFLGHTDVDRDSLVLEVLREGEFVDVTDPSLFGYRFEVFPEPGLVALAFPPAFFEDPESQLRASYRYTSTSGVYVLGLSIVKGSDRVFLNGQLLQRETDYTIDYETGSLILFRQVGPDDVLRIEYEVLRGGLGGFAEYRRSLSQLSFVLEPQDWLSVRLDLFQGADHGGGEARERLRTMPNTHTVAGLRTTAELGRFQAALTLGGTANAFPFDDNRRAHLPNRINAIAALEHAGRTFVLFAHQNGLTVFDGTRWTLYDTRAGLSGRSVYDVAVTRAWAALATETGLTLIRLEGEDPFAVATNWRRFYQQDGLAHNRLFAVAFEGETLWVGTADGLTRVPLDALDDPRRWTSYRQESRAEMLAPEVTQLALAQGLVYVGSPQGLQIFDPLEETFVTVPELRGAAVHDLAGDGRVVYVASDRGLRALSGTRGSGWLVPEGPIYAVATAGPQVWYAPERGLRGLGPQRAPRELNEQTIRALGIQDGALWVGPQARVRKEDARFGPRYELVLWRVSSDALRAFESLTTRLDGRDLNRFQDVPLEDHLDLGGLGSLALSYRGDRFRVTSALEGLSRAFTAIGSTARQDYLRWRLSGDYDVSSALSVTAEHTAGLVRGRFTVGDTIGLRWRGAGPRLELNYREQRADTRARTPGFDQLDSSLSLSLDQRLFDDLVRLSLGLEDEGSRTAGSDRLAQNLTLSGGARLDLGTLRVDLDLRSPLRLSRYRDRLSLYGSGRFDAQVRWSPRLELGGLTLDYRRDGELRFPGALASSADALELSMDWDALNWQGALLVPRSGLTLELQRAGPASAQTRFSLENVLQARWQDLSARLRWSRDLNLDARSQRAQTQDALGLGLDYAGWEGFSPGLDWTLSLNRLRHPVLGRKANWQQQLTLRLGWRPRKDLSLDSSWSGELVHNDQEQSARLSVSQRLSWQALEPLSLSLNLNGTWNRGRLREEPRASWDSDATLQGTWKLSEDWTATFSGGVLWGRNLLDPEKSYLSGILSANAAMTF